MTPKVASISSYKESCPECGKVAKSIDISFDEKNIYHHLACGHELIYQKPEPKEINYISNSGHSLFPFQKENVAKFQESGGKLCIFDEMGLGKSASALAISRIYNLYPTLIICKSALKYQWLHMIEEWASDIDEDLGIPIQAVQIIETSSDAILQGMKYIIVSYDLLSRLNLPDFKLIIVDECQYIKNTESLRTRNVTKIAKKTKYLIFTSGTPIKNHAAEFFPTLHLCNPARFRTRAQFISEFIEVYRTGQFYKLGGLRNYERFKEATKHFIIRHTQDEVMQDLPEIRRNFIHVPVEIRELEDVQKSFKEFYYKTETEDFSFFSNVLAFFAKMRHMTGLGKIDHAVEFVNDFIESTNRKIIIFVHHIDVREILAEKLAHYKPLILAPDQDNERSKELFNFNDSYKVLIASTLMSEGHNLQHACSDAIMLERQWNPANEEQAEFRLKRPGQKSSSILINYFIGKGTIDEHFTKLVEEKRASIKYSLDGERITWNERELIADLARVLAAR